MKTKLLRCDVEFFIERQYPLTIVADRYGGCYSGGNFLAFPCDYNEIENEVAGSDHECQHYWDTFDRKDFWATIIGGTLGQACQAAIVLAIVFG